jgi:hypothetical protein
MRQRVSDSEAILIFSRFHIYAGDGDLFNNFSIPSLGSAKFVNGLRASIDSQSA